MIVLDTLTRSYLQWNVVRGCQPQASVAAVQYKVRGYNWFEIDPELSELVYTFQVIETPNF